VPFHLVVPIACVAIWCAAAWVCVVQLVPLLCTALVVRVEFFEAEQHDTCAGSGSPKGGVPQTGMCDAAMFRARMNGAGGLNREQRCLWRGRQARSHRTGLRAVGGRTPMPHSQTELGAAAHGGGASPSASASCPIEGLRKLGVLSPRPRARPRRRRVLTAPSWSFITSAVSRRSASSAVVRPRLRDPAPVYSCNSTRSVLRISWLSHLTLSLTCLLSIQTQTRAMHCCGSGCTTGR
jgi:hypothetical protein